VKNKQNIEQLESLIQEKRPDHIIIHIGGNDLDSRRANKQLAEEVALKIVALCDTFKVRYSVVSIAVCQLLPRESTRVVEQDDYNNFVKCANEHLRTELSARMNIFYWKLKGLKNSEDNNYDDGVHVNDLGMLK
jgi:lysophospholipase L1-like esterase